MNQNLLAERGEEEILAEARRIVDRAAAKDLDLQFLGVAPLFHEVRHFTGPGYDWVVCPAGADPMLRRGTIGVPRRKLRTMRKLSDEVAIPAIYIAHEIPTGASRDAIVPAGRRRAVLSPAEASELVPSPPPDAQAVALASGASKTAEVMVAMLTKAARATARVAQAVGDSARSVFAGTDPIILGAITLGSETEAGCPAAWVVIARWDW